MHSEPDEEVKSSEGRISRQPEQNRGNHPTQSDRSPPPDAPKSTPVDLSPTEGGDSELMPAAHLRPFVGEVNQSRYGHFCVEIDTNGQPVELGRGAMGVTYRAIDTTLRRPVALKVISSRLIENEALKSRFIREARAAASLRHPNVASVFYLGSTGSTYFYAMELVTGETLEQFIEKKGPLEPDLALDITVQVTSALVAAHQAGLVHRDIKPANLILTRDEKGRMLVKVVDFGLVKLTAEPGDDSAMSDPGTFLGTPRYASPEQFSGGKIDIRSDLYAVGITLWHMLTKALPFSGTPTLVAAQHLQSPLPISELRHLPYPIVHLLTHLLEKNPDDRPQTPEELLVMLNATRRAIGGQLGAIEVVSRRLRPRARFSRFGKKVYLALAIVALVAGAAVSIRLFSARPVHDARSVAVLPFDSVGDDNQNAYLSDGITAEVIFQLSKIADLRVISRDSVLRYKAMPLSTRKSMREIANELEVATLLESNVQRLADRLKVRSVLYDANSGKQLWSQSYDREVNDLFAIQTDVAESIAAALHVRLSQDERNNIQRSPTANRTAYDLYLRANEYYELRHENDNERAIALYQQAIEQDPKFALAYVGLANGYIERADRYGGEGFLLDSAVDLCRKAVSLDPRQVRAYTGLARALYYKGLDREAHEQTLVALKLAPNDPYANWRAAYDADALAKVDEQYRILLRCHALSPNSPEYLYNLGAVSAWAGETETMEKWMDRAIKVETDPQRRTILKCERLVFRHEWQNAITAMKGLPLELLAYDHSVFELLLACSARSGDWNSVMRIANSKLGDTSRVSNWRAYSLLYLALAERQAGREAEMKGHAQRLGSFVREKGTEQDISHWEIFYLAASERFLGQKEQAYNRFGPIFSPVLRHLPLMSRDPALDIFRDDPEFQDLTAKLESEREKTRAQIRKTGNTD
jgi:serine/threonine protein kinase/tetratricopeptide (TPR) repeat protein